MIINGQEFKVIVNVKQIKKIYMRIKTINNENYIVINSYKRLSEKEIKKLIELNPKSIERLIQNIKVNPLKEDEILILGKIYNINESKVLLESAYKQIIDLFEYYKDIFNKKNTQLKFRKMKTRWGVCHITKNYINLSTYLVHVPIHLIEYVIIHEFCHFKYPNHSPNYYKYLSNYCSDYKNRIKELKKFSYVLK